MSPVFAGWCGAAVADHRMGRFRTARACGLKAGSYVSYAQSKLALPLGLELAQQNALHDRIQRISN